MTEPARPATDPRTSWTVQPPRLLWALIALAGAWIVLTGLHELQNIAAPLLLVVNLVIVAHPIQARLTRRGYPRIVGASVLGLLVFAILAVFVFSLVWSVLQLVDVLPDYQGRFQAIYASIVQTLEQFGVTESQIRDQLQGISPSSIAGFVTSALSQVTGAVTAFAVIVTIVFVMLIDSLSLPERITALVRTKPQVAESLGSFVGGVRRYWVVSSVFGLIVAVLDVILLLILDVPLAGVWGVLAFLTNFIPNIGFVIGVIPPALMALLAQDGTTALLVVVFYSGINFVIQSIIQPKFNGEAVGVTATVSLLSLLLWTWVLGPLGALLALPATLLAKSLLIDADPQVRWLNAFIASAPSNAELAVTTEALEDEVVEEVMSDAGEEEAPDVPATPRHPGLQPTDSPPPNRQ